MAYKNDTKAELRRKFVFDNLTLEVASNQLKVPQATASRWKRDAKKAGDDWDKVRAARLMANGSVDELSRVMLSRLIHQFDATMEQLTNAQDITAEDKVKMLASLSDAYNKAVSASKRIMPTTTQLATALDVVKSLTEFIQKKYPQHLTAFSEILEPFGAELERKYV